MTNVGIVSVRSGRPPEAIVSLFPPLARRDLALMVLGDPRSARRRCEPNDDDRTHYRCRIHFAASMILFVPATKRRRG